MKRQLAQALRKVLTTHAAWPVLLTVTLLCMASLLAIGVVKDELVSAQARNIVIGAIALMLLLVPHYKHLGKFSYVFFGITILLLALVLLTEPSKGARRWFSFAGIQIQPSELAKITFVLAMAWFLRHRKTIRQASGLLAPLLMMAVPVGLILIEPDLGTALLFPLVLYAMLIGAGARFRHLVLVAVVALLMLPGAYPLLRPYQKGRIKTLIYQATGMLSAQEKQTLRQGGAYQQYQSLTATGSGGLVGQGPDGSMHLREGLLPEAHNDFVFAVVGTQWGFVGDVSVLLLYLAFYGAAMEIAGSTRDPFARLTAVGLGSLVMFQAFINMAMTMGLAPVVGIALPFLSYGGSSLLTNMAAAGILLNISIRRDGLRMVPMPV